MGQTMRNYIAHLLIVLPLLLIGCGSEPKSEATMAVKETYKEGEKVELKSVTGAKVTLLRKHNGFVIEEDEGKLILIDIFGTFCPPCQEEAPALMDFQLQNSDDVMLIGLNFLEEVSDEYVIENFAAKYNAYYFISNSPKNKKLVETILQDIAYKQALQVPFKVLLKEGVYQKVTDIYEKSPENKFYIGKVGLDVIQKDIDLLIAK
jgi:thiol-disulfide isomerase/thioredoxin